MAGLRRRKVQIYARHSCLGSTQGHISNDPTETDTGRKNSKKKLEDRGVRRPFCILQTIVYSLCHLLGCEVLIFFITTSGCLRLSAPLDCKENATINLEVRPPQCNPLSHPLQFRLLQQTSKLGGGERNAILNHRGAKQPSRPDPCVGGGEEGAVAANGEEALA